MPTLTRRFDEAFVYAHETHAGHTRKGSGVPYIGHLMGVASIVIDDGGTEDEAIAALLHDAAEDCGGRPRLEDIRPRFGDTVAGIVEDCTDSWTTPKGPWAERKQQYVQHARTLTAASLRVSAADKVHNATRSCATSGTPATRSGSDSTRSRTISSPTTSPSCDCTGKPAAAAWSTSSTASSARSNARWGIRSYLTNRLSRSRASGNERATRPEGAGEAATQGACREIPPSPRLRRTPPKL